ncbi:ABC transporter [Nocardioides immobilis]|uniref:ABC transporter n=1 Tax=Nocardioides immobilis TaxID=2049295 RepID=A0A417Y0G8_9ACTN|nr:ABC transporter permease [Nocardioides immobilis]RHW26123.1 ABC transporter [Nocardioides immobilis]
MGAISTGPISEAVAPRDLPFKEGVLRQVDYWATLWARTWRGVVVSSFLSPFLYVLAMGVLLGGFVAADPDQLEGAPSYLAFVVPGLIASHAMQTAVSETTWPVMGMIKWQRIYESMLATPLQPRHVVGAHLASVALHLTATCALFTAVMAPFGVYESWWGPFLAFASQVLCGMTFATLVYAFATRSRSEESFGVLFRLGVFPLFLFSGAFFPVSNLGDVGSWLARLTPLWQGVNLSRMFALDHVTWWVAGVNVAVLVVLMLLGWRWSVSGLTKRMIT